MDFSERWENTVSSVSHCCQHGLLKDLQALIANGAALDSVDNRGWMPLHEAAASTKGSTCLKELLKHEQVRSRIDWQSHAGRTALFLACKNDSGLNAIASVKALLRHEADPNIGNNEDQTPLLMAIKKGNLTIIKLLLKHQAKPNSKDFCGWSPLHAAVTLKKGSCHIINCLLEAGAEIFVMEDDQRTPVFLAAQSGNNDALQLLIETSNRKNDCAFGIVNVGTDDNTTPLMIAAQGGYLSCIETLLKYKADPNATDKSGLSALHLALVTQNVNCLKYLCDIMDLKPMIKACNPFECQKAIYHSFNQRISPLQVAIDKERYPALEHLLSVFHPDSLLNQEDRSLRDWGCFKESILCYAISSDDRKAVDILLDAGACCNKVVPIATNPMHEALKHESDQYVQLLLNRGCDVNCIGVEPPYQILASAIMTVWHLKTLLLHGCDPEILFRQMPPDKLPELFADKSVEKVYHIIYLILQFSTVHGVVQRTYDALAQEIAKRQNKKEWKFYFSELDQPSSLQHLCRMKIRRQMYSVHGVRLVHRISDLSLPQPIKNYLQYEQGIKCFYDFCTKQNCSHLS